MTTKTVEPDSWTSPFEKANVTVDPGSLEVGITDNAMPLGKLQFVDAVFTTENGERLPLTFDAENSLSNLRSLPHNLAIIRLNFSDKQYYPKAFSLTVITRIDSEQFKISGTFSEHSHTRIVNWSEAVDPGGH